MRGASASLWMRIMQLLIRQAPGSIFQWHPQCRTRWRFKRKPPRQTVFKGPTWRTVAPIQSKHVLRLPSCFGQVLERKRARNSSAISRYSGAIFRNLGAFPKSVQSKALPRNPCVCKCLYLPVLAHLFATKAPAHICVSMGPAGFPLKPSQVLQPPQSYCCVACQGARRQRRKSSRSAVARARPPGHPASASARISRECDLMPAVHLFWT